MEMASRAQPRMASNGHTEAAPSGALDTSGGVFGVPDAGIAGEVWWPDLDPFTQGYTEALFASLAALRAPSKPRRRSHAAQRVYEIYRQEGQQHSDLDPHFRCGRIGARKPRGHAIALAVWEAGRDTGAAFSNLAPETLARIMEDCGKFLGFWPDNNSTTMSGRIFWRMRQRGDFVRGLILFPPLTPYLGDDGGVYLREG